MNSKNVDKKLKDGESWTGAPLGSVVVKNVSNRTLELGKPGVTLFPGETGVFSTESRGVGLGISSKWLKIVNKVDAYEEPKAYVHSKKKKNDVQEPTLTDETVSETVASDEVDSSVQLGLVDTESSPSEQQEGN